MTTKLNDPIVWAMHMSKTTRVVNAATAAAALEDVPDTDLTASRFIESMLRGTVNYTGSEGWYRWDGKRHALSKTGTLGTEIVVHLADVILDVLNDVYAQIDHIEDEKGAEGARNAVRGWLSYQRRLQSSTGIKSLVTLLQTRLTVANGHFDSSPNYIAMASGEVLNLGMTLATGEPSVEPADASKPITRLLGASLEGTETGTPSRFLAFLRETVGTEEEVTYLQQSVGAAFLGEGTAKTIPNLVGLPNSGKSVFLRIIAAVFGDYAGSLPASALTQKYGGGTNFAQSQARGVRFLYLSEPQTTKTDDAFLKNLSGGGEPINTEQKGKDSVAWRAQCVLFIAANHIVKFDTSDRAIVDRMNVIEFTNSVQGGDVNPNLVEDILNEEQGEILAWIIDGAKQYHELRHVVVPEVVKARAQAHVVDGSPALRWLTERVEDGTYTLNPAAPASTMVKAADGFQDFQSWLFSNGERSITRATWKRDIEAHLSTPQPQKNARPGGYARLWAVQDTAQSMHTSAQIVQLTPGAKHTTWEQMHPSS